MLQNARQPTWFMAAFTALLFARPLRYGTPLLEVVAFAGYLGLWVILPGWLAYRRLRRTDEDWLEAFGTATVLGYAVASLAYVVLNATGARAAYVVYPLLSLPLAAWRLERQPRSTAARLPAAALLVVLLLVAAAAMRTLISPEWCKGLASDLLFHAGNAAEITHHWPLRDPRFTGFALNYHFVGYGVFAGASHVTGRPVADLLLRTGASLMPALLALQVYNLARVHTRSVAAGLVACALVVFAVDVGVEIHPLLGASPTSLRVNSYLELGIYGSPSTVAGLVLFTTIAALLRRTILVREEPLWRSLGPACVLCVAASGVKGSVLPVVIAGLFATAALGVLRERRLDRRVITALLAVGLSAAPMTLWLVFGEASYAGAMFRVLPLHAMRLSPAFGGLSGWARAACFPLWLIAYLGPAGVGAVVFAVDRGKRLEAFSWFLLLVAASGIVTSSVVAAAGLSELFFLYNGQIGLAALAGAAYARRLVPHRPLQARHVLASVALALAALPFVLGAGREIVRDLTRDLAAREASTRPQQEYREGLEWIRHHTPTDALFLVETEGMLTSVFAERRTFYETDLYTPAMHATYWSRPEGATPPVLAPERLALRDRFYASPTRESLDAIALAVRSEVELYAIYASMAPLVPGQRLPNDYDVRPLTPRPALDPALGTQVFANEAMAVYRLHR